MHPIESNQYEHFYSKSPPEVVVVKLGTQLKFWYPWRRLVLLYEVDVGFKMRNETNSNAKQGQYKKL